MSIELVEVDLYPIPKFDTHSEIGEKRLDQIIAQGPTYPNFRLLISRETLDSKIVPLFYFPGKFSEPPFPENRVKIIKYQIVKRIDETESGISIVYGFPISVS